MKFTGSRFVMTFVFTVVLLLVALAGLRAFGLFVPGVSPEDPMELVKTAQTNLDAVRRRQPGERRPASYDSVLTPLDKLLRHIRDTMQDPAYNPDHDFEKVRALAVPVIDVAGRADQQARNETGPLAKSYRFCDQKAEASQYLAAAMWQRMLARMPAQTGFLGDASPYPPAELNAIRRVIDDGLTANPDNLDLYSMRATVYRAEGLFAAAARDLEKVVELDPQRADAWNTLGLVRVSLKEFDGAEEAYERAKALALSVAQQTNTQPGPEYVAIIYNLATFHDGLATYYTRESRINPTVESERLAARHAAEARRYFEDFLGREPSDSPDAQIARGRLSALR